MTADPEDYGEFVDPTQRPGHFLKVLECGELVVLFSIATAGDTTEIALGMRPDLVEEGRGVEFLRSCLDHARMGCAVLKPISLNVATFNVRAIRVYEKAGFKITRRFRQATHGAEYDFLEMKSEARPEWRLGDGIEQ